MEPDLKFGRGYVEALKEAISELEINLITYAVGIVFQKCFPRFGLSI
jgi:hypothetical protein